MFALNSNLASRVLAKYIRTPEEVLSVFIHLLLGALKNSIGAPIASTLSL